MVTVPLDNPASAPNAAEWDSMSLEQAIISMSWTSGKKSDMQILQ